METIVKLEDIYKFLESLRKLGAVIYVLQWGGNHGSDFVVKYNYIPITYSHISFDVQVEDYGMRSQREKEELKKNSLSNKKFISDYKSMKEKSAV